MILSCAACSHMKRSLVIAVLFVSAIVYTSITVAQRKTQKTTGNNAAPNAQTEWKTAASSDKFLIEFSPRRLTRISPTVVRVWTRRHSTDGKSDSGFTLSLNEYNCKTRAARSIKTVMYDASGRILITQLTSELYSTPKAEWEFVVPNTLGEDELDAICKFRR
jgi:hypothetical protein